jgi:hypothetical protein
MRASLTKLDYNVRRDFVAFGGDGDEIEEFRTIAFLKESSPGWRFRPVMQGAGAPGDWFATGFDDRGWRTGQAPIGYGEPEIETRKGTVVEEKEQSFWFRREFDVPSDVFSQKGVAFRIGIASDDSADVWLNGQQVDKDPEPDHEFSYWNRDVELTPQQLKPGKNLVAVLVRNKEGSSDIYLDMEIAATIPVPKPPKPVAVASGNKTPGTNPTAAPVGPLVLKAPVGDPQAPTVLTVDAATKTVALPCRVAPRKLPNLNEVYPIEVIATYPAPHGRKAHETVLVFTDVRPSDVHAALEKLGAKPGKPAKGEGAKAEGPVIDVRLEVPGPDGRPVRLPFEQLLVNRKTAAPVPALRWHFTGSVLSQPDPERNDKVYGADSSGTLLSVFPVTDETVLQSQLTLVEEAALKLEVDSSKLPKEGTPVRLVLTVK